MKKFYFVGCSGTYGDDLSDKERQTVNWPVLISKHHGAEYKNDSAKGGSNQRIITKTLQNIGKFDRYYIQWTVASRFTLHDASNWYDVNFNANLVHDMYSKVDYFNTFGKYYYTHWYVPVYSFKTWLEQVVLLQDCLKLHNAPYLMLSARDELWKYLVTDREHFIENFAKLHDIENFNDTQILQHHDEIQHLLSLIDFNNFIVPTDFCIDALKKTYPAGRTKHLLADGIKHVADYILEFEGKQNENK